MLPIIVTTTCDSKEVAETIVKRVLEKRLAACVQVSGPFESSYWWEETITVDQEFKIQMKSEKSLFLLLSQVIRSVHPYDVPEIIATEICAVDDDYLTWMKQELSFEKR